MFEKVIGLILLFISIFWFSFSYSERFLEWLRFQSIGSRDYIVEKLNMMFYDIPSEKVLLYMVGGSAGVGAIVFLLLLPHFIAGLMFGVIAGAIAWKLPKPIVNNMYQKRTMLMVVQMVDALALMSNGMKSGLSVVQSIGLVTTEMPNPIRQEFELILNQNKVGVPLEECFTNLSKRVVSDDVEMFVTSVNILKETGGNLAETFDTIVGTIRERIKLENKISAMTAQGFYQGMFVIAIPPLMGTMFYLQDPDYMEPLFTHWAGWIALSLVLVLEVVGFFVIMKIVKVEV